MLSLQNLLETNMYLKSEPFVQVETRLGWITSSAPSLPHAERGDRCRGRVSGRSLLVSRCIDPRHPSWKPRRFPTRLE
jgi:hypothetical protein